MATARTNIAVTAYAGLPELGVQAGGTAADTVNGNRFSNIGGDVILVARNTGGVSYTVQFTYTRRGQTVAQTAVTLLASGIYLFGPFPPEMGDHPSADAADGDIYMTANNAAVQFTPIRIPGLRG